MRKAPKLPVPLRFTLPILVGVVIIGGVFIAGVTDDSHWMNRAGALVSAIAGCAILWQVAFEVGLDSEARLLPTIANSSESKSALPMSDLGRTLEANRLEERHHELHRARIRVSRSVIVFAVIGELLHGFGDLGYQILASASH